MQYLFTSNTAWTFALLFLIRTGWTRAGDVSGKQRAQNDANDDDDDPSKQQKTKNILEVLTNLFSFVELWLMCNAITNPMLSKTHLSTSVSNSFRGTLCVCLISADSSTSTSLLSFCSTPDHTECYIHTPNHAHTDEQIECRNFASDLLLFDPTISGPTWTMKRRLPFYIFLINSWKRRPLISYLSYTYDRLVCRL